jgi:hypothetical protein
MITELRAGRADSPKGEPRPPSAIGGRSFFIIDILGRAVWRGERGLSQSREGSSTMTKIAYPLSLLLPILICSLLTSPAHAQRARVFVASFGNDANSCSFLQPCRTFQVAVNAVLAGGEVTAIDSAGFGPISITKAVTITSPAGVEAGIVPSGSGMAINVNAGVTDVVSLHGLVIDGTGTGTNGINFTGGQILQVQDCVIRNFTGDGIFFGPSGSHKLSVTNTVVSSNGVNGVSIGPTGTGTVDAVLDHVELANNGHNGVALFGNGTGIVRVVLSNSVSSHNNENGVLDSTSTATTVVMVQSSVIAANNTGLRAIGSAGTAIVATRSAIVSNALGLPDDTGATVSAGDNLVTGNTIDGSFKFKTSLQ